MIHRRSLAAAALLALLTAGCSIPRWPVEGRLTSPFGLRFLGLRPDLHHGVDVAVPEGTPVRAMQPGRVAFAGSMRGYGLAVRIDHGHGLTTLYAHLSELRVEAGQRVEGTTVVGLAGRTGNAMGAHLHFEVRRDGRAQDPVPLLGRGPQRR